jgi:hypothetical protein
MKELVSQVVAFVLYVLLQVFVFQHMALFDVALPKVAILFVLFIPMGVPAAVYYLIAFCFGFLLDLMIMPLGANAFTFVLIASIRPFWVKLLKPQINKEELMELDLRAQPLAWHLLYCLPLVFCYESVYASLADFGFDARILLKILTSTLYTGLFVIIFTVLFYKKTAK